MQRRLVIVLTMAINTLAASPAPAEVLYNITDLGTLGGEDSYAYSINGSGQIVGHARTAAGSYHATLFDPTGEGNNIELGTLGYSSGAAAYSINDNNEIAGKAATESGNFHAALFDPTGEGNNIDLGTLGGNDSEAWSVNIWGQIAGYAQNGSNFGRATLFEPTGSGDNIDLGTLGGNQSDAYSINASGQIVGGSYLPGTTSVPYHATLFDPTGGGHNIDLGTLGGKHSCALSINNIGQIAGWALTLAGEQRAALFDPTGSGNNINLNSLVDPALGWVLTDAECINDDGWIVGRGKNPDGHQRAYLMRPISEIIGGYIDWSDLVGFCDRWLGDGCADAIYPYWCNGADIDRGGDVDFADYFWLGYYWEDIAPPPNVASAPDPNDLATNVSIAADLSWRAGTDTVAHGVYFGTSGPGNFQGYQTSTTFSAGTMETNTTYYWRIDEVGLGGTTSGAVWSFTIAPALGQGSSPSPTDTETEVSITTDLSWSVGPETRLHDVDFGTMAPGGF